MNNIFIIEQSRLNIFISEFLTNIAKVVGKEDNRRWIINLRLLMSIPVMDESTNMIYQFCHIAASRGFTDLIITK